MKIKFVALFIIVMMISPVLGQIITYTDSQGDIDPGIATAGGTLDIVAMEVSNTATDVIFTLTVNGNITTTDWGNFMIGIATTKTIGTTTGNGWNRPINMEAPGAKGMNYWIGSWVNSGGGTQLWSYNGTSWAGPAAIAGHSMTPGAQSTITYTVTANSLGLVSGDFFYFDAYSSGGGGTDGAVDALADPNVSITSWSQVYTSDSTSFPVRIKRYNLQAPLPVQLSSFNATIINKSVNLKWETATEQNNYGFEIERKLKSVVNNDNSTWQNIGFVNGNGNSNSPKEYSYTDNSLNNSGKYSYRLKQVDNDGSYEYSSVVEVDYNPVINFELGQNYPNPFNPSTVINYSLSTPEFVTIKIFNTLGQEVATLVNSNIEAGRHSVEFDASNLTSGLYLYKIQAGSFTQTKKMLLTK